MNQSIDASLAINFGFASVIAEDAGMGQGQSRRFKVTADGQRYVAKHLGQGVNDPSYECRFLQFLGGVGIPAAKNVPTSSGEPFAMLEGRPLVLYEWADGGVSWPAPAALAEQLGSAIARMHLVSDPFSIDDSAVQYDIDRLIDRPLNLLEPFSPDKRTYRRLVELSREIVKMIENVPTAPSSFGPIHGDIHQGNCHFTDEGDLTIIDFSLCGIGYRAYDLTGFLWPMRDRTIEDPAMAESCQAFLRGYEKIRPLVEPERTAIQAFVQVRSLWESGDWLDTGTGSANAEEAAKMAPYLVQQFEAWMQG